MLLFLSQKYVNFLNIAFLDFFKFKLADFQHIKFLFSEAKQKTFLQSIFPLSGTIFFIFKEKMKKDFPCNRGYLRNYFNSWNFLDQYCG